MWWLGNLYKYYIKQGVHQDMKYIYKILPFNRFVANFNFYHTQGWDYVIDDAIENYKTGNYIV